MPERDKHALPDKIVSRPQLQGDKRSARVRRTGDGADDRPRSQMQADHQRLRQAQLDADREQGVHRRAPMAAAHRSVGPEDESRNQPRGRAR